MFATTAAGAADTRLPGRWPNRSAPHDRPTSPAGTGNASDSVGWRRAEPGCAHHAVSAHSAPMAAFIERKAAHGVNRLAGIVFAEFC